MYARWREESVLDPEAATLRLRSARGDLFHDHPQSPLPPEGRSRFSGLAYWSYDPAYRLRARLEAPDDDGFAGHAPDAVASPGDDGSSATPAYPSANPAYPSAAAMSGTHWPSSFLAQADFEAPPIQLPASGDEPFSFRRIGRLRLSGPLAGESLAVFWMEGYAGGLFVPFRDATSAGETYGAGRYLLDTVKGADLGGDYASGELLLDFNLAYHPSCAYDQAWNCPLAPVENTLRSDVAVGERLNPG